MKLGVEEVAVLPTARRWLAEQLATLRQGAV